jgi:hypothetical protein
LAAVSPGPLVILLCRDRTYNKQKKKIQTPNPLLGKIDIKIKKNHLISNFIDKFTLDNDADRFPIPVEADWGRKLPISNRTCVPLSYRRGIGMRRERRS